MDFNLNEEIKRYPFIRIVLPLILGIILSINFTPNSTITIVLLIVSLLLLISSLLIKNSYRNIIFGISFNLTIISVGLLITFLHKNNTDTDKLTNYQGYIIGEVSDDPKISEKTSTVEINVFAIKQGRDWISTNGKTLLYLENDTRTNQIKPGDKIVFSPQLSEVTNKGNPEEFDYKQYLSYNMIYNTDFLATDDWNLVKSDYSTNLNLKLLRFRQNLITKLASSGMSDDELAVISALALGYKDNLSDELNHAYASSGAMHILAVSGLHVGIIYGILLFLFSFIRNEKFKIPKTFITIVFIWIYAILTGLSPSVSRAALMFSIIAIGQLQNRSAGSLNAVAISAFILLIINPYNITNIGFQLSYVAVIGIILLYPKIYGVFNVKNRLLDKIWALTAVSVAAQIATAPIAIYYFHQFSNYFVLANYLLIPVSIITIWICILFFAVSGIGLPTGIIIKSLNFLIKSMNKISLGIESLPFSVTEDLYLNLFQLGLLYLIIITLIIFIFHSKKYKHLVTAVIGLIIFTLYGIVSDLKNTENKNLVVYNINKASVINLIDYKDNILFANIDSIPKKDIEFSASNNWLKQGLNREKYINISYDPEMIISNIATIDNKSVFYKDRFIGFYDKRIFIADQNFFPAIYDFKRKFKIDILLLSNDCPANLTELKEIFDFEIIIIDSSNSFYRIDEWLSENEELKLKIHNVNNDGAFICSI